MYFGYSIESWLGTSFGSIDKNQIKIGNKTYTIAGLHENDQDDNTVILAVSDYIDYENTQVYICKENDSTVFSINILAYDMEGGYKGYLLKPLDTYLFHLNWSEVPKTFRLWIADSPPPLVRRQWSFREHRWRRLITTCTEKWHNVRQNLKSIFCHQIKNGCWFNCARFQLAAGGYHV